MNKQELINQIKLKKSLLCIGLDTDIKKIPKFLMKFDDPVFEFNKRIIDVTKDLCVAYKLNTAFYEANGVEGWQTMNKTMKYIPNNIFSIADAKRGDIGNTSAMYAQSFFQKMNFDALTVNPYMGIDSVEPFFAFENKWVILLALTSNKGSDDFQKIEDKNHVKLYEQVISKSSKWADDSKIMYVVGATKANYLTEIRKKIPNHFLLIPGVGAQGGNISDVMKNGLNKDFGLLINSSRSIIYAGKDENFTQASRHVALEMKRQMEIYLG